MTEYVVLMLDDGWHEKGTQEAASARAAVVATMRETKEAGTYIAIPARSWQPMTAEFQTHITIS